ncbi:MAG: choice-of-anchor A family protein [Candidatus Sumerlaeia bacterium]|nr:choice-of-anchor A family protein [Candidatus Sumerlaeia bacterium]
MKYDIFASGEIQSSMRRLAVYGLAMISLSFVQPIVAQSGQMAQQCLSGSPTRLRFYGEQFASGFYRVLQVPGNVVLNPGGTTNGEFFEVNGTLGTFYYVEDLTNPSLDFGPFIPTATDCTDESSCDAGGTFDQANSGLTGAFLETGTTLNGGFNAIVGGTFNSDGTGDSEGRLAIGGDYINPGGASTFTVGGGAPTLTGGPNAPIGWDNFIVSGTVSGRVGVRGNSIFGAQGGGFDLYPIGIANAGLEVETTEVDSDYLDIQGVITRFQELSTCLSTTSIGTLGTVTPGPIVTLDGLNATGLVRFSLTDAPGAVTYNFVNVGNAGAILVNVGGATATFTGGQITVEGNSLIFPYTGSELDFVRKTVWNFHSAQTLNVTGYAVNGSVIAAYAVNSTLLGGSINGQVVLGGDVTQGTGFEFHNFCNTSMIPVCGALSCSPTISSPNQVLNTYSPLSSNVSVGSFSIQIPEVAALGGLETGDRLMIYNHQGADSGNDNTSNYGVLTNLQNSGRYEIVEVFSVTDRVAPQTDIISLNPSCDGTLFAYTATGSLAQVVKVPRLCSLNIRAGGSLTGQAFNGTSGGVVALLVDNTLTVNGQVVATGLGFRGGVVENTSEAFSVSRTDFRASQSERGANKGEAIDRTPGTGNFMRGALVNGGGGGNSGNAGGGGGGNGNNGNTWTGQGVMTGFASAWALDPGFIANGNALTNSSGGGRGGYSASSLDANALAVAPGNVAWGVQPAAHQRRELGGLGGRPVANDANSRLFLGGGGGAGEGNDGTQGAGGRGGGLVLLIAPTITGTGSIVSNGAAGGNSTGLDAAGGGGAGGTIVLESLSLANTLNVTALGGRGGDQVIAVPGLFAQGPGGGGGGGYIQINGGTPITNVNGGSGGVTNSQSLTEFPPNGATNGASGQVVSTNFVVPTCSSTPFVDYAYVSGVVFHDQNNSASRDFDEPGIGYVTMFLTQNALPVRQIIANADGTYGRTVVPGTTQIDVEPNQDRIWPLVDNTTSNLIQSVNAVTNGTNNFNPIGFFQPSSLCVIDWTGAYNANDFFGGYPSTGPASPTQDGREPRNYAELPVGTGDVIFYLENEHMLDGQNDGTPDLPAILSGSQVYGFGYPVPPHVFYRKAFVSLIVNDGQQDGLDPVDQLDINYYFPFENGASNVRFLVYDVDDAGQWIDRVTVTGVGLNNTPVIPTVTALRGASTISLSGNQATGVDPASDTSTVLSLANAGNLLVDFGPTPIRSMRIYYENTLFNPAGSQGIGFTNILFEGCDATPGRIAGNVFRDTDNNGVQDFGEPNLPNVDVTITTFDGVPFVIQTDENGEYNIGVPPGLTTVTVNSSDSDIPVSSFNSTNNATQSEVVTAPGTTSLAPVGYSPGGPTPTIDITSSRSLVGSLTTYQYTVTWSNIAPNDPLNIAKNPVITVPLDTRLQYLSAGINSGFTGTITRNGNLVTFTLNESIEPGESGSAVINVRTPNPVGTTNILVFARLNSNNFFDDPVAQVQDSVLVQVQNTVLAAVMDNVEIIHSGAGSLPRVVWSTASELGTAGWDAYRLSPKATTLIGATKLNKGMMEATGSEVTGGTYSVIDPLPLIAGETRSYILVETEFSGNTLEFGPYSTTVEGGTKEGTAPTSVEEWMAHE